MNLALRLLPTLFLFACGCGPTVGADPANHPRSPDAPQAAAPRASASSEAAQIARSPEAPSPPKPDLLAPKTFDLKAIDEYVARYAGEHGFVGLSLAILKDGKVVLAKGYGTSSLETGAPVGEDTAFGIGSVTKQFTCASLLLLAEDGKLSMEDKVAKYYPGLTRAKDITLLDLLTHVSGYPDYYPLDFVDQRMQRPITHDALIQTYAGGKLDFEPRTRFSYSNTGYILAGRVVEKVSGEQLGTFLERRIFKPLGMTHSFFEPNLRDKGLAQGYTAFFLGKPEPAEPEAQGWLHAAGGLYATATDLARWDLALIEGKVLKPKSFERMTKPVKLTDGTPKTYACGLGVAQRNGETVLQHNGAVSGFLAVNTIVPRTRSAIALLTNSDNVDLGALQNKLVALLLKDLSLSTAGIPKVDGPRPDEAALSMLRSLMEGTVDRSKLGEEFSRYLKEERVREVATRLKGLGELTKVEVEDTRERGGMEVASLRVVFKARTVKAGLYRTPDGKIQQLLLYPE